MYLIQMLNSRGHEAPKAHPLSGKKYDGKDAARKAFAELLSALPVPGVTEVVIRLNGGRVIRQHVVGSEKDNWIGRDPFPPRGRPAKPKVSKQKVVREVLHVKRQMVTLDKSTIDAARRLGLGNLSLGLRIAVERVEASNRLPEFEE